MKKEEDTSLRNKTIKNIIKTLKYTIDHNVGCGRFQCKFYHAAGLPGREEIEKFLEEIGCKFQRHENGYFICWY